MRVEGERASGTASQEPNNRPLSRVWKGASGQWKTNTQTDADVLTAAEALCESKTGRNEEKLVNKQKKEDIIHQSGVPAGGHGVVPRYSSLREQIGDLFCMA